MEKLSKSIRQAVSRRTFLAGLGCSAGTAAALTVVAGCGGSNMTSSNPTNPVPPTAPLTDADVLNFALNLEYLEAEYYLRAATGSGLSDTDAGTNAGAVTGGSQVQFKTMSLQQYALEIANDELAHVRFLRKALGSAAVSRPAIDLTNSFNAAATAAGIGPMFNPFADENSFIVGAFTFEDVGVTAYHGGAGLLQNKTYLAAAAGIMATEAYHAAEIRTLLTQLGGNYLTYANQISALRAAASGGAEVAVAGNAIVAADSNSIAFDRTTDEVLHIVYLNATRGAIKSGGFFPNGLNGTINTTAS
ncbi:MAG TPA: ferritin-like domain-containing protein [Terracidiphilus sp.]|nr:ferritin-like domain-containing protein [Terracidiphilus sp.]